MTRNLFLVSAVLSVIFLYSCSSKSIDNPNYKPSYSEVLSKWTKQSRVYSKGGSDTIIVDSTYKSPEFRDAFSNEYSKQYGLASGGNNKTVYSEIIANSSDTVKYHEFFISMYTPNPDWSDLDKKDSIWNLYLEIDGNKVKPVSIEESNRADARTINFYPYIGPWSKAYVVRFPLGRALSDLKYLKLLLLGVKGPVELLWDININSSDIINNEADKK